MDSLLLNRAVLCLGCRLHVGNPKLDALGPADTPGWKLLVSAS